MYKGLFTYKQYFTRIVHIDQKICIVLNIHFYLSLKKIKLIKNFNVSYKFINRYYVYLHKKFFLSSESDM